jgi:hypothetical protein
MALLAKRCGNRLLNLIEHLDMGTFVQGTINLDARMFTAEQGDCVNEPIELGLRVPLDDRLEFPKQGLNDVAADEKRELSDPESRLNSQVARKPGFQSQANLRFFWKFFQERFCFGVGRLIDPPDSHRRGGADAACTNSRYSR